NFSAGRCVLDQSAEDLGGKSLNCQHRGGSLQRSARGSGKRGIALSGDGIECEADGYPESRMDLCGDDVEGVSEGFVRARSLLVNQVRSHVQQVDCIPQSTFPVEPLRPE